MSVRVHSMTGFGTVQGEVRGESFALTLKSVNHRHLDLQVRLPGGLGDLEAGLRLWLKQRVRRGHVELSLTFSGAEVKSAGMVLNEPLLLAYAAAYRRAGELLHSAGEPDVATLVRMPGVMSSMAEGRPVPRDAAEVQAAVMGRMEELFAVFEKVRAIEGEALATELRLAMGRVLAGVVEAGSLREQVARTQATRLRTRMAELLGGIEVSEDRLIAEAALLAERGDVEEELVRLRTHATQFCTLLDAGGEVGKPLDFLLQELNREANTLLAKTGGSAGEGGLRVTEIGLQMKVEFERAREQVQNLE